MNYSFDLMDDSKPYLFPVDGRFVLKLSSNFKDFIEK
jgi:hypothetical protein